MIMTIFSLYRNAKININMLILLFAMAFLSGCYSFTGGSVPEYLKTLYISSVVDNSGFGNPHLRDILNQNLISKFRDDGTFKLAERSGDATLSATLVSITETVVAVKSGELERERKITVSIAVDYYNNVKRKSIWTKTFSTFETYQIATASTARDLALETAIKSATDDILLAVISGW